MNWQAKLRDPKTIRVVFGVKFVIILGAIGKGKQLIEVGRQPISRAR